jgi:hypothetical protein
LRINLGKSKIILIGEVKGVEGLAQLLGCRVTYLPMTYLGLPLGASYKAKWNGGWLDGWKRMYLSKGG